MIVELTHMGTLQIERAREGYEATLFRGGLSDHSHYWAKTLDEAVARALDVERVVYEKNERALAKMSTK